jgi:hypothetical protein
MFDGKYNAFLDSAAFRAGALALAVVVWVGGAVALLAAA